MGIPVYHYLKSSDMYYVRDIEYDQLLGLVGGTSAVSRFGGPTFIGEGGGGPNPAQLKPFLELRLLHIKHLLIYFKPIWLPPLLPPYNLKNSVRVNPRISILFIKSLMVTVGA